MRGKFIDLMATNNKGKQVFVKIKTLIFPFFEHVILEIIIERMKNFFTITENNFNNDDISF